MATCAYIPAVYNNKKEEVPSKLFEGLLQITNQDRAATIKYYRLGTDSEFLALVDNEAKFDENNEITVPSLIKLGGLNIAEDKIIASIEKKVGVGTMDYNTAIYKLQQFNTSSEWKDSYLATFTETEDKVTLSIVPKTLEKEQELFDRIKNRTIQERLISSIAALGVSVNFLEQEGNVKGRYSTENAQKTADGFYSLIDILTTENTEIVLAEEAGHLAVGALGNSPLIQRLEALLTPELQEEIMGSEYTNIINYKNPQREVAGHLVGKYLQGKEVLPSPVIPLLQRIKNALKSIFIKEAKTTLQNNLAEAHKIAQEIASGFLSPAFEGTLENALNTKETLYSADLSNEAKAYRQLVKVLNAQAYEVKRINEELHQSNMEFIKSRTADLLHFEPDPVIDELTVDGIVEYMMNFKNDLSDVVTRLMDMEPTSIYNIGENSKIVREATILTQNAAILSEIIQSGINVNSPYYFHSMTDLQLKSLAAYKKTIDKIISQTLTTGLKKKQEEVFLKLLSFVYGDDYITVASRVVFARGTNSKVGGLDVLAGRKIHFSELIRNLDYDISLFERYWSSMSASSDVIAQIIDMTVRMANRNRDEKALVLQQKLAILRAEMLEDGVDTSELFERSSTGELTGNFITEHKWGEYEKAFQEKMQEIRELFITENNINVKLEGKEVIGTLNEQIFTSDVSIAVALEKFRAPLMRQWHKENSKYDEKLEMYVPNAKYENTSYKEFKNTKAHKYLKVFMQMKEELNDMLEEGSTPYYRAPQFKTRFAELYKEEKNKEGRTKGVGKSVWKKIKESFLESSEDQDFGSNLTYNKADESVFLTSIDKKNEAINRVPMFGIVPLEDMRELSTDLFQSMLAFGTMAYNYKEMSTIVDTLELGKEVLGNRTVEGKAGKTSRAFARLTKFYEKNLYNVGTRKIVTSNKIVVNKVLSNMNNLGATMLLSGNVASATVGLLSGTTELFKEAAVGQFFSLKDFKKANKIYFEHLPENVKNSGNQFKEDKLGLWSSKFDVTSDIALKQRGWFTKKAKFWRLNPLGENRFGVYKSAEHYLQNMGFLSLAMNTYLYDTAGNKINLWDAYQVVPVNPDKPEGAKKLSITPNLRIVDPKTGELRTFTTKDETVFAGKARDINDKLHGIYNEQNSPTIAQSILGNSLLSMRRYALGFVEKRFGASKENAYYRSDTEGSLRTFAKAILLGVTSKDNAIPVLRSIFLPYSKKSKELMAELNFSPGQMASLRRNFNDMVVIALLALLQAGLRFVDEDKENIPIGIMYYFVSRVGREQMAFNTPWGIIAEAPGLTRLVPAGASAFYDLMDIGYNLVTEKQYEQSSAWYEKGDFKGESQVLRRTPYLRTYLQMQNPYDAAASYEYGRISGK